MHRYSGTDNLFGQSIQAILHADERLKIPRQIGPESFV